MNAFQERIAAIGEELQQAALGDVSAVLRLAPELEFVSSQARIIDLMSGLKPVAIRARRTDPHSFWVYLCLPGGNEDMVIEHPEIPFDDPEICRDAAAKAAIELGINGPSSGRSEYQRVKSWVKAAQRCRLGSSILATWGKDEAYRLPVVLSPSLGMIGLYSPTEITTVLDEGMAPERVADILTYDGIDPYLDDALQGIGKALASLPNDTLLAAYQCEAFMAAIPERDDPTLIAAVTRAVAMSGGLKRRPSLAAMRHSA